MSSLFEDAATGRRYSNRLDSTETPVRQCDCGVPCLGVPENYSTGRWNSCILIIMDCGPDKLLDMDVR